MLIVLLSLMGFLSKLKFWKKDEEFNSDDFDALADKEAGINQSEQSSPFEQDQLGLRENKAELGLDERSPFESMQGEPKMSSSSLREGPSFASAGRSAFEKPSYQQRTSGDNFSGRELELISSKLDTIKAMLQMMDQRIANLEKAAGIEQQQRQRLW